MSLIYQSPDHLIQGKRPGIYLGGKSDSKNKAKLLDRGITHILNLTPPKETSIQAGVPNYFERDPAFTYRRIPVYDSITSVASLRDASDEVCRFISTALCHGSILVHCQRGVSRSVTAVLLYLVRRVGLTPDEAMALVKRRRPESDPIPEFLELVRNEYQSMNTSNANSNGTVKRKESTTVQRSEPKRMRKVGPEQGPRPQSSTIEPTPSAIVEPSLKASVDEPAAHRAIIGPTRPL